MDTNTPRDPRSSGSEDCSQVALLPHQGSIVQEMEFQPEDAFWEKKPGVWELNPLLLARIAERIALDGDVPELRSTNLPEEGMPAVPVVADTTNPVLLGMMLQKASTEVKEELEEARRTWEKGVEAGLVPQTETMPVFGAPGYHAGQIPTPRVVEVQVCSLSTLTPDQESVAAFQSYGTTQGRNSLVPWLARSLLEDLRGCGLQVQLGSGIGTPRAQAAWTLSFSNAGESNPRFSPIRAARASLSRELLKSVIPRDLDLILDVRAIHTAHERTVGWKASLHG